MGDFAEMLAIVAAAVVAVVAADLAVEALAELWPDLQFVWWGVPWRYDRVEGAPAIVWTGWCWGWDEPATGVYDWRLHLGPVEIRCWSVRVRRAR